MANDDDDQTNPGATIPIRPPSNPHPKRTRRDAEREMDRAAIVMQGKHIAAIEAKLEEMYAIVIGLRDKLERVREVLENGYHLEGSSK